MKKCSPRTNSTAAADSEYGISSNLTNITVTNEIGLNQNVLWRRSCNRNQSTSTLSLTTRPVVYWSDRLHSSFSLSANFSYRKSLPSAIYINAPNSIFLISSFFNSILTPKTHTACVPDSLTACLLLPLCFSQTLSVYFSNCFCLSFFSITFISFYSAMRSD